VQLIRLPSSAALAASLAVLALAVPARANKYEVAIAIDDEQDLYDLATSGQISEETLATLVELYQRGVDLNTAGREELYTLPNLGYVEVDAILAYRELSGFIADPRDLVTGGVLSQGQLEGIAAFLMVGGPAGGFATDGWARAQTRWSVEDDGVPATALQARISTLQYLTAGVAATLTRERLGEVRYDPTRDALSAAPPSDRVVVPKFFAAWETPTWGAIAGTFRIGFGQRLTFDNTSLYTPNGFKRDDQLFRDSDLTRACKETDGELAESPCAGAAGDVYVSPDYRWSDALLGVAAGLRQLRLGAGRLQAYGFASYNQRDLYQYELYDRSTCDDPSDDDAPGCAAPEVFRRGDDVLAPASRYSFQTLPDVFAETTVGGNLGYHAGRRAHLGVTAYTSSIDFLADGAELDFQEWSRFPRGGRFGAAGVDGSIGVGRVDLFAEATRSFDAVPDGGGGFGGLVRAVTNFTKKDELEASLRWYGEDFINPYARAIAAPDESGGQRVRDERGARLRYTGVLARRLTLRGSVDLWQTPSRERWNVVSYARGDVALTDQYGVGVWLQHQDKDIGTGGRGQCFEVSTEEDDDGETIPCSGQQFQVAGRLRYSPTRRYTLTGQYQHDLVDDPRYPDRFRQDYAWYLTGAARPADELVLRGRVRYLSEDLSDDGYLERSLWSFLEVGYRVRPRDWMRLRYDLFVFLDHREATEARSPSPEHRLWLEYESRF
jgi:hypothetical protein